MTLGTSSSGPLASARAQVNARHAMSAQGRPRAVHRLEGLAAKWPARSEIMDIMDFTFVVSIR